MIDYEAFYDSTDCRMQENIVIQIRELHVALLAFHQTSYIRVIKARLDCALVVQEILNNVRILFLVLRLYRALVAQLVEHRAAMKEVVSLTPTRPTLRS